MTRRAPRAGALALGVVTLVTTAWLDSPATLAQQTSQQPQRPPVFRGGANFVLVDAYPTADGKIVEGLQAADFQVSENGVRQAVTEFEFIRVEPTPAGERFDPRTPGEALAQAADPHNRLFVIYLDHYHVNVTGSHATRRPLVDMLERVLAPNDLFGVTTVNMRPRDIVFGRTTTSLAEQLSDSWSWGLRQSAMLDREEQLLASCVDPLDEYGADEAGVRRPLKYVIAARLREDKVLTHLEGLIEYLGTVREARKSLILFTNGWLLYGPDHGTVQVVLSRDRAAPPQVGIVGGRLTTAPPPGVHDRSSCQTEFQRLFMLDNRNRMSELVARANRQNVTFYPVNPSGLEVFDIAMSERVDASVALNMSRVENRIDTMRTLSDNTDGLTVVTNDLSAGLRRIVDDVSAYYVLGYSSTNPRADGTYRRIEVKINRPGVRVRARRGYLAPKPAPESRGPATAAGPAMPAGFADAMGVLSRLRTSDEVFTHAVADGGEMSVTVELAAAQAANPRWTGGADVRVQITTAAGEPAGSATGRIEPPARGVLIRVPLLATSTTADAFRVSVSVGAGSAAEATASVRRAAGTVIGDPVVYRAMPAGTSPLRPAADFQFRRTERVHIEWAVRGDVPDRRAARLLNRTGQPMAVPVTVTTRDRDGRTMLAADLALAPLADGDYVIELVAGPEGAAQTSFVGIRVTR
jgi:VWFA-related protein